MPPLRYSLGPGIKHPIKTGFPISLFCFLTSDTALKATIVSLGKKPGLLKWFDIYVVRIGVEGSQGHQCHEISGGGWPRAQALESGTPGHQGWPLGHRVNRLWPILSLSQPPCLRSLLRTPDSQRGGDERTRREGSAERPEHWLLTSITVAISDPKLPITCPLQSPAEALRCLKSLFRKCVQETWEVICQTQQQI